MRPPAEIAIIFQASPLTHLPNSPLTGYSPFILQPLRKTRHCCIHEDEMGSELPRKMYTILFLFSVPEEAFMALPYTLAPDLTGQQ